MTRETLRQALEALGTRSDAVSFDMGQPNEAYGIVQEADGWHVFYGERGLRRNESTYATEAEACDELLARVGKDPTTRRA